jgi:LPS-assembly protein
MSKSAPWPVTSSCARAACRSKSDEASLYQAESRGELSGDVRIRDNGALIVGDHADVQLDTGEAKVDNAEYVMHKSRIRGSALYAKRAENAIIRLKDGTYTTCEPNSNAWQLKGNNITLNPATGFGTATNVTLRVKDIPILYTPYIYFPIDDRRQSGFLPPTIGSGSDTGFMLVTPYYFNLAPNYDATLYPRYMSKRGLLVEGEFRYLTKSSEGQFGAAYLNDEDTDRSKQTDYEKTRYMYNWQHKGGLDSRVLTEVDYTKISDPYYFQDLQTDQIGVKSSDYVNQQGAVTYRGDSYTARLNAQQYQLATVSNITPYGRLPQITFNGQLPYHPEGLNFDYETEIVRFDRDLKTGNFIDENGNASPRLDTNVQGLARANGDRLNLKPGVSLPMNWTYGFLKPSLKYQYTQYQLDLDGTGKSQIVAQQNAAAIAGTDYVGGKFGSNQNRGVPIASVDSGLYFDRNTSFGKNYRQTLEPRLFYLYVPEKDQEDIPVFDTSEYTFNYASLFRDNRFSGSDRVGDENKLSLGVTSRWIEDNGFERQRISVGQALYFKDREVQLPGIDAKTRDDAQSMFRRTRWNTNTAGTAIGARLPITTGTRTAAALARAARCSTTSLKTTRTRSSTPAIAIVMTRFAMTRTVVNGRWAVVTTAPRVTPGYVKDYYKIQQHDFSVIWPIVPQWNAISRWQYDYNRNRTLEAFGGFEYDNCCWKLRLINRYWVSYDEFSQEAPQNEKGDHGVFLQIVLKGLGGLTGAKVESFLDKGIQGYREREDQAF